MNELTKNIIMAIAISVSLGTFLYITFFEVFCTFTIVKLISQYVLLSFKKQKMNSAVQRQSIITDSRGGKTSECRTTFPAMVGSGDRLWLNRCRNHIFTVIVVLLLPFILHLPFRVVNRNHIQH